MLALYLQGKTIAQIGTEYSITRQRVQQILSRFEEYRNREHKYNSRIPFVVVVCPGCGNEFKTKENKKHCSMECRKKATENKWNTGLAKVCTRCKILKDVSSYYPKYGEKRNVKHSHCKECQMALSVDWRKRNVEKWREISRRALKKWYSKKKALALL